MAEALGEVVIERQRQRLRGKAQRITIELDPTDDPTHGAQQLSLFNGHYETWYYLPVAGFIQFKAEPEQYLFTYMLRPDNAPAKMGAQTRAKAAAGGDAQFLRESPESVPRIVEKFPRVGASGLKPRRPE